MADLELESATVSALEALGLGQLDSLDTCNTVIGGDVMDLLDTTELPSAKAWETFGEALEAWRAEEAARGEGTAGEFWSLVSQAWGGDTGTGHKALLALLQLAVRSKEKGEEPWLAAKTYLLLMDLPGASAYGVFNSAMFRSLLALLKAWLEGHNANASGGSKKDGDAAGGDGDDEDAAAEQQEQQKKQSAAKQAAARRKRAARRRGGEEGEDEPEEEEDQEDDEESDDDDNGDEGAGGRGTRKGRGGRAGRRGGAVASRGSAGKSGLEQLLRALERSIAQGSLGPSLQAHDDVQGELTDLVLAIYAVSPASAASLGEAARALLMSLVPVAGGDAGNPIVLRALMPLLVMRPTRGSGIPSDARTRTAAHQKAVQVLQTLVKEGVGQRQRLAEKTSEEQQQEGEKGQGKPEEQEEEEDAAADMEVDSEEEEEEGAGEGKGKKKGKAGRKTRGQKAAEEEEEGDAEKEKDAEAEEEEEEEDGEGVKKAKKKPAAAAAKKQAEAPTTYHTTVLAVLEHMCAEAPDRADVRSRLVDSVLGLVESLQAAAPELGPRFVRFLAKLLRSAKVAHRAFGVEIAAGFVNAPWAWPSTAVPVAATTEAAGAEEGEGEKEEKDGPAAVWASLVALVESFASRVLDKAPTVRARAMVCLSEMLISVQEDAAPPGLRQALLALAYPAPGSVPVAAAAAATEGEEQEEPVPRDLVSLVRSRCQDDKAVVRKAALQALEILLTTGARASGANRRRVTPADVALFAQRCNDVSVLTRKQAMASLSSLLLAEPGSPGLQDTWVRAVLPLVADPEQSILNRLVDLLHEVLLDRVVAWHRQRQEMAAAADAPAPAARARRGGAAAPATEEERAAEAALRQHEHAKTATVWELLAMVASRDLNKCLQNAVGLVLTAQGAQQASPRRLKEIMEALQSAALASIDAAGAADGEDRTALRRGAWALLEAILARDRSGTGSALPGGAAPGASTTTVGVLPSDPAFVVTCWRRAFEGLGAGDGASGGLEDDARKILRVLARIAPDVPGEMGMGLAEELLAYLAALDPRLSPENCGAALETIAALCLAKAPSPEDGAAIIRKACQQVLDACEAVLRSFVVGPRPADKEGLAALQPKLERATFLVGAVAILGFTANEEIKSSSSSSSAAAAEAGGSKKKGGKKDAASSSSSSSGNGPLIRVPVPPATISLLRVLLLPEIRPLDDGAAAASHTQQAEAAEAAAAAETGEVAPIPEEVRALAFLSLGKACLRDKPLAKENVNLFVRELSVGSSAAIKSNALLILGDLCVRYTSMVERHVPAMARCLQDESSLIRRHALALISQLLLQDYLKWRGLLLHRYLAILVDKDPRVVEVAEYVIFTPLLRKCPSLFVNHFVEALVVLNGCVDHDSYKAALSQGAESGTAVTMEGVDLEGDGAQAAAQRMHIYRRMLQHMTDEQRIQVTAKLTQDVLGAATDEDGEAGGIKIQSYHRASRFANGQRREAILRKLRRDEALVRDALAVLRCPDIKVAAARGFGAGGAQTDEDAEALMMETGDGSGGAGGGADAAAAAKGRLLSKVSRKHLLEHVVPELVSLKACLERAHSPLLRDVMEYLMDLMRSHKEEVKDALSASLTLFHEIEYDLQQFEREKERKAQEEAAARAAMPPPAPVNPNPPKSPGDGLRASAQEQPQHQQQPPRLSTGSVGGRRRSSVSTGGRRTPGGTAAKAGAGAGATPNLAACSAPRLRRSSVGAALSRTPAEAIRAALQPGSGTASQPLTPVPLLKRDDDEEEDEDQGEVVEKEKEAEPEPEEEEEEEEEPPARTTRGGRATRRAAAATAGKKEEKAADRKKTAAAKKGGKKKASAKGDEEEAEENDGMTVNVSLPKARKAWKVSAGRSPLDSKENVEALADEEA